MVHVWFHAYLDTVREQELKQEKLFVSATSYYKILVNVWNK